MKEAWLAFRYICSTSSRLSFYARPESRAPLALIMPELERLNTLLEEIKPWIEQKEKEWKYFQEKFPELFTK